MGILNPKRKQKEPPKEAPKWFMVMMVGFVFYAIINSLFTDKVSQTQKAAKKAQEAKNIEFFFSPLLPLNEGGRDLPIFTRDKTVGSGPVAGCWETVDINYRLYNRKNELIEEKMDPSAPVRFEIGRGKETVALERGTLGMQKNGRREITARPELAFGAKGFAHPQLTDKDFVAYDVTLLSTTPTAHVPVSNLGLRFYDDWQGKGKIAQCTDSVEINIRGWKTDGSALWPAHDPKQPVTVTIGRGKAPYAVERALMQMQVGGKRTVIVPPGYGQPLFPDEQEEKAKKTADFRWQELPIPQNEAILLEIELTAVLGGSSTSPFVKE